MLKKYPVVINEMEIARGNCCFNKKENIIYIIVNGTNVLFSYDLYLRRWNVLNILPSQYLNWNNGNAPKLFIKGMSLLIISELARGVLIYDLETNTYEEFKWKLDIENRDIQAGVAIIYEDNYIILPFNGDVIVKCNCALKSVAAYSEWKQELLRLLENKKLTFLNVRRRVCVVFGQVFGIVRCKEKDIIFSICLETMRLNGIYEITPKGILWDVQNIEGRIWIQIINDEKKSLLSIWNPITNRIERKIDISRYGVFRTKIIAGKDKVYVYPMQLGKILMITNDIIEVCNLKDKIFAPNIFCDKSTIIAFDKKNKKIEMLDMDTAFVTSFTCQAGEFLMGIKSILGIEKGNKVTLGKNKIGKLIFNNCKKE